MTKLQSLNYNKDQKKQSSYHPPVNPYDVKFHRGQKGAVGDIKKSNNAYQEEMAKVISEYTQGKMNSNDFRGQLQQYKVPCDANIDKLIRRHEAGDFISYNEFGKNIYRQLNG